MTKYTQESFQFPPCQRRVVDARFEGGLLLLRQADKRLGLMEAINRVLPDPRDPRYVQHDQLALLRQRVYGLCQGYEDLNDHDHLRNDLAIQTAVDQDQILGSSPTLCRLENRVDRKAIIAMHDVLIDQFIASYAKPPKSLVLDFDAIDDRVHGDQEGRFFHGYYDHYCFLPLYVFCGDQLLVSYLRPGKIDGAKHAWAILSLLVKRLRQCWPAVHLVFRGDSGFCRHRMLRWYERRGIGYIVGLARNTRLQAIIEADFVEVERCYDISGDKQRVFLDIRYGAKSWGRQRSVIAKLEITEKGRNPRFVVTRPGGDNTIEVIKSRCGDYPQYPACSLSSVQYLSPSIVVLYGGPATGAGIASKECYPGTMINNGVRGKLRLKSENARPSDKNQAKYTRILFN